MRIAERKDGRTRLAHKVDFSSGVVVAVTAQPADAAMGCETVCEAGEQIATVAGEEMCEGVDPEGPKEVVLDIGLPQQRSAGRVRSVEGAQLLLGAGL